MVVVKRNGSEKLKLLLDQSVVITKEIAKRAPTRFMAIRNDLGDIGVCESCVNKELKEGIGLKKTIAYLDRPDFLNYSVEAIVVQCAEEFSTATVNMAKAKLELMRAELKLSQLKAA